MTPNARDQKAAEAQMSAPVNPPCLRGASRLLGTFDHAMATAATTRHRESVLTGAVAGATIVKLSGPPRGSATRRGEAGIGIETGIGLGTAIEAVEFTRKLVRTHVTLAETETL